jgi:outer membrane protein OmpA-like peptidoglycan-associated protein
MIPRIPISAAALAVTLALWPGIAAAEPTDPDMKAALEHHFAQSAEPAPMPGGEAPAKAKTADPTASADAMVSFFTTDVPEDITVAARRPQVDLDIKFDFDSSTLSNDGIEQLDTAGQALNDPRLASRRFMLGGHTDDRGESDYNRDLSRRRAETAKKYLIEKYGISPDRLETAGFGSTHPKDRAETPEARQRNRRVVLEMIE